MNFSNIEQNSKWRKISLIQRFFIVCSGADKGIIDECHTEWNKYAGIGATVFFTGLLACLSGGYALYTVFRGTNPDIIDRTALHFAIPFGLLWGAVIFNLDRFIVSTFHKSNENVFWKRLNKELLQASPRILLAIIIAITISKPIEIKIFESRLAEQIQQNKTDAYIRNRDVFLGLNDISGKTEDVIIREKKDSTLKKELADDPDTVISLKKDLSIADSTLSTTQKTNNQSIRNHNQYIENIRNDENSYSITRDEDGNVSERSLSPEADAKISKYESEVRRLQGEINASRKEVNRIKGLITEEREKYKTQKNNEIDENKLAMDDARATLNSANTKADNQTTEADSISKRAFTSNFITQIEALGDLKDNNTTMWWTSFVITLLFLVLELAPILTKLITKRGVYEEILERTEYENMITQKEMISRINSKINALLQQAEDAAHLEKEVRMTMDKDRLDAELKNNKIILDAIAQTQQELALKAIAKWREKESAKINLNEHK